MCTRGQLTSGRGEKENEEKAERVEAEVEDGKEVG